MAKKKVTKKVEEAKVIKDFVESIHKVEVNEVKKASDELLLFMEKHKTIIAKAKLDESFIAITDRIKYIEKMEK